LGQDAIDLWDLEAIPPIGWTVDVEDLIQAWTAFFEQHRHSDEDILVVTSNGIARFVLDTLENLPLNIPRKLRTAAFGLIELSPKQTDLIYWDKRQIPDITLTST